MLVDSCRFRQRSRDARRPSLLESCTSPQGFGGVGGIAVGAGRACVDLLRQGNVGDSSPSYRHQPARRGVPVARQCSYDRLFPSQDVHTGRGMGNLIAAPLNGKRRKHGTTVFLDPATLEPFDDQWAYLSSIARLSANDVARLCRALSDPQIGHRVRRLQLPTASKIVPRPAAIIRATFASRITLTANDLGPAMISAIKHAASFVTRSSMPASVHDEALGTPHASSTVTTRPPKAISSFPAACTHY